MVGISFITPAALALLLLLPALWAFALLTPRRLAPWRFRTSLLLRSAILTALVLAISGAQLVRPVRELTTVFLIDASDSVAPVQRERAVQYVNDALAAMPPGHQAAVVAFGENALVERAPSAIGVLGRLASAPVTTRTNIQEAVQLGLALLPAETQKRLVLLSDGGENSGRAVEAARLAAVRDVPIDVVFLPGERGADVIVAGLTAPAVVREGQEIGLQVVLSSTFGTAGRLQIFVDGQIAGEQDVSIPAGESSVAVRVPAGETGFRRLEVRLDAQGDAEAQNNRAAAFTEVQGPPRILLIAADVARAANLRDALIAAEVRVDVRPPEQAPASLEQLGDYAGVVIVDTPARAMPRGLIEVLPAYVRDLGRGLTMVGGADSFGAGGYRRTPLEPTLPVNLDPLDTREQPDLALAMVIDRSGSMDEPVSGGSRTKLDLAKEAVYQASLGLSPQDQVGLIVFDDSAQWVMPVQRLPSAVEIERALGTFDSGGGTNIRPGVELAAESLTRVDARIKHVILLTDGIAESNYSDLIAQMQAAGITISTVAIGSDANPNLRAVAEAGGGRAYRVTSVEEVPQIFLQETVLVAGRDIIEQQVTPAVALPSALLRSLGPVPPLYGYNGTEPKEAARTLLVTPDGKPLLAQWQYGLGRVVAWTSDLQGKWARDWVTWDQFVRFSGGLVDLMLPPRDSGALTLRATTQGAQAVLDLSAQDEAGRPLNDLALVGRIVDPTNQDAALRFTQVGPGRYRAVSETGVPGVYLAQVAATGAEGQQIGTATTGLAVSYSLEYGERRENQALLADLAGLTGGRVDSPAAEVFAPPEQSVGSVREIGLPLLWLALLLWPLDIALRRVMLRMADLEPVLARLRRPRPAAAARPVAQTETMARLSAAKQRSRPPSAERAAPSATADDAAQAPLPRPQAPRAADPPPARPPAAAPPPEPADPDARPDETPEDRFARLLAAKQRARRRDRSS